MPGRYLMLYVMKLKSQNIFIPHKIKGLGTDGASVMTGE